VKSPIEPISDYTYFSPKRGANGQKGLAQHDENQDL